MLKQFRVLGLMTLLALTGCGRQSAAPETAPPGTDSGSTSTVAGSCVEQYSLENLKKRDFAFDGTVRIIEPGNEDQADRVTFDVHKWYKGGQGTQANRRAYGFTAVTSAGGSPHAAGERLLVAGDEDFVWECGFTQAYNASVAAEWEQTLND